MEANGDVLHSIEILAFIVSALGTMPRTIRHVVGPLNFLL